MLLHEIGGPSPQRYTVCPHPMVRGTGRVGVEVELENMPDASKHKFKYWTFHADGSLRNNGAEFVFSEPLGGSDIFEAVREFELFIRNQRPDPSWRTSTHVHLDVRDIPILAIKKTLLCYLMFETILIKCYGQERATSNFCPSVSFAQYQLLLLSSLMNVADKNFLGLNFGDKYSCVNLKPIAKFGSIEFRGSRAVFRQGQLLRQINRVLSLREMALKDSSKTLQEFCEKLAKTHPRDVFGSSLPKGFDQCFNPQEGFYLAMDAVCHSLFPKISFDPRHAALSEDSESESDQRPITWEELSDFARREYMANLDSLNDGQRRIVISNYRAFLRERSRAPEDPIRLAGVAEDQSPLAQTVEQLRVRTGRGT